MQGALFIVRMCVFACVYSCLSSAHVLQMVCPILADKTDD